MRLRHYSGTSLLVVLALIVWGTAHAEGTCERFGNHTLCTTAKPMSVSDRAAFEAMYYTTKAAFQCYAATDGRETLPEARRLLEVAMSNGRKMLEIARVHELILGSEVESGMPSGMSIDFVLGGMYAQAHQIVEEYTDAHGGRLRDIGDVTRRVEVRAQFVVERNCRLVGR